jgi:hypothetical protein
MEPDETLSPILDTWASMSDEKDQNGLSERARLVLDLQRLYGTA